MPDRLAELLAFSGVLDARLEAGAADTHRLTGNPDAPPVEGVHGDVEPSTLLPDEGVTADTHFVELDLQRG